MEILPLKRYLKTLSARCRIYLRVSDLGVYVWPEAAHGKYDVKLTLIVNITDMVSAVNTTP